MAPLALQGTGSLRLPLETASPSELRNIRMEVADNKDFLGTLGNESMHLIVTSPPYNIGKQTKDDSSPAPSMAV